MIRRAANRVVRFYADHVHSRLKWWRPDVEACAFIHASSGGSHSFVNHRSRSAFARLSLDFMKQKHNEQELPPGVHCITYSNYAEPTLLESAFQKLGVPIDVVARDVTAWNWTAKVIPALAFLETRQWSDDEICIFLDANDILPTGKLSDIVRRFNEYDCDQLFCGTCGSWPSCPESALFESRVYPQTGLHHLSAGGYMGRFGWIRMRLAEVRDAIVTKASWAHLNDGTFDDQLAWRRIHQRAHPRIKVDYAGLVFQRFDDRYWWRRIAGASTTITDRLRGLDVVEQLREGDA